VSVCVSVCLCVHTGTIKQTMRGGNMGVMCVAFSKNDEMVLAGSNDNAARVWAVDTGRIKVRGAPEGRTVRDAGER
jgi:WD40 repeat protein